MRNDPATGLPSDCFPILTTSIPASVVGTTPADTVGQPVACGTFDPGITTVPFNTGTITTTSTTTTTP